MSSTVADALTNLNDEKTTEPRLFIRLFDQFFDCLNVKSKLEGVLKRKDSRLPYTHCNDDRFKVCNSIIAILCSYVLIIVAQEHILEVLGAGS